MIKYLLLLHLLGASVWVGGHLLLLLRYLPEALKSKNPAVVQAFEKKYEPIGIPALLLQVITGIFLGMKYDVKWFSFASQFDMVFNLKLITLALTLLLAIHARFFIIPKLNEKNLNSLALHIGMVSVLAFIFVFLGVTFRYGW
ncbi:MAG: CopD family protein [Capnocytophaga sp.]|nr:CopD family protein [Capnocytophaga sp.]